MKKLLQFDFKEAVIRMVKSEKRNKIWYTLFFSEAILAFLLFAFVKSFSLFLAAVVFVTYILGSILDILNKREEKILRENSIFDVLMSDKTFVTTFLYWGVEIPIAFTVVNVIIAIFYPQLGLSVVFWEREIARGDWLLIVMFLLVFLVNLPVSERVTEHYEKNLIK